MAIAAPPKMFLPEATGDYRTAIAHRRPLNYTCTCGRRELVGPPCAKSGTIRWTCDCGQEWLLRFQGHGSAVKDDLFKRGQ